ncbi:unnamed protein product [Echinostoma caproni]|uniref:Tubulin_C domain-containing protein n=1 Tax=Echinostoma caproni TaxID=27848 RepID=A0A183APA8_9TREM|nr:unnamed protein product [Echinostoma caproni]
MQDLTMALFSPSTQLLTGDPSKTHVLACALLCRGDIAVHEIKNAVTKLKQKGLVHLVPWCPTGFKIGLCLQPPTYVPQSGLGQANRSVVGLYNSTLIVTPIRAVTHKVTQLSRKRAFVHWYLQEGLEEGELTEAQEGIQMLLADFQNLGREFHVMQKRLLCCYDEEGFCAWVLEHGMPANKNDIPEAYSPEEDFGSPNNLSIDGDVDALQSDSLNQANMAGYYQPDALLGKHSPVSLTRSYG